MSLLKLSEALIRTRTSEIIFTCGQTYYQQGAVGNLVQRGPNLIEAEVNVSNSQRYYTSLHILDKKVMATQCSGCETERWCEHITATLLKCLYEPSTVAQRPALENLLAPLSRPQLQGLIGSLVRQQPGLINQVEHLLLSYSTGEVEELSQIYKREVNQIRRKIRESFSYGFENDLVRQFLTKTSKWRDLGKFKRALTVLEILTQEAVRQWQTYQHQYEYVDDGFIAEFLVELDTSWATLFLAFPLTVAQREYHKQCLTLWEQELAPLKSPFQIALKVLEYEGLNYAPLQQVLQGESNPSLWEDEPPPERDKLVKVYLHWLLQQQRYKEYLCLAKDQEHHLTYLQMLFKLDKRQAVWAGWELVKKKC
jgi:hypothetical protein